MQINKYIDNIVFPCAVVDVGFYVTSKAYNILGGSRSIGGYFYLSRDDFYNNENSESFYISSENNTTDKYEVYETLKSTKTIISHNAETDLSMIDEFFISNLPSIDYSFADHPRYCTMIAGLPFSTGHIHMRRVKIKKYPKLYHLAQFLGIIDFAKTVTDDDKFNVMLDASICHAVCCYFLPTDEVITSNKLEDFEWAESDLLKQISDTPNKPYLSISKPLYSEYHSDDYIQCVLRISFLYRLIYCLQREIFRKKILVSHTAKETIDLAKDHLKEVHSIDIHTPMEAVH